MKIRSALIFVISLLAANIAIAQSNTPQEPYIGANVDMGVILPGSPNYIKTPQGDLFDIAKSLKLNTFRITDVETWSSKAHLRPSYTAEEWKAVGDRAKATGIRLIPILELAKGEVQEVAKQQGLKEPNAQSYIKAFTHMADTILGDAGLAKNGTIAMVDLSNEEPIDTPMVKETFAALYSYIHTHYPGILVTVGDYKTPRTGKTIPPDAGFKSSGHYDHDLWVTGNPDEGGAAVDSEDIVSVHMYGDFTKHDAVTSFGKLSSVKEVSDATLDFLTRVSRWSQGKPILVEEFGAPSGLQPVTHKDRDPSPEHQQKIFQGVVDGIKRARQSGINVVGATAWILTPRGGKENYGQEDNEYSVIIPNDSGTDVQVLPAIKNLHYDLKGLFAR